VCESRFGSTIAAHHKNTAHAKATLPSVARDSFIERDHIASLLDALAGGDHQVIRLDPRESLPPFDSTAARHQIFEQNVARTVDEAQTAIAKGVQPEQQRLSSVLREATSRSPMKQSLSPLRNKSLYPNTRQERSRIGGRATNRWPETPSECGVVAVAEAAGALHLAYIGAGAKDFNT